MQIEDILFIGGVVGAINTALLYVAKLLVESLIKHEFDEEMERVKSEWRRTDVLNPERLAAFKLLQKSLVSLRRHCEPRVATQLGSEFGPGADDLKDADYNSILGHWNELETRLDEYLIFLSGSSRASFDRLRAQLWLGASMELALGSSCPGPEAIASRADRYAAIRNRISECIDAMFDDLGFACTSPPRGTKPGSRLFQRTAVQ